MRKTVLHSVCAAAFVMLFTLFLSSCATTDTVGTTDVSKGQPASAGTVAVEEQGAGIAVGPATQPTIQDQQLLDAVNSFQLEKIYFDYDKYELSPEARDILTRKAQWLKDNAGFTVRIEGHCDERGTNEYNLALGERRAQAAFNFLVTVGVPADRISTISFGEEKPFDPGHDEDAWAKNRRDEFVLSE